MIKLPRKYTSNGIDYKIGVSKEGEAGYVDLAKERLYIRKDCLDDDYTAVEVLIHEMLETTLHCHGLRYYNFATAGDDYLFNFTHKNFKIFMAEFARGMLDLIEANRSKNA